MLFQGQKNSEGLCNFRPIRSKVKTKDICHVEKDEVEGRTVNPVAALGMRVVFWVGF